MNLFIWPAASGIWDSFRVVGLTVQKTEVRAEMISGLVDWYQEKINLQLIWSFVLVKWENVMVFFVSGDKLKIFRFWTAAWTKQDIWNIYVSLGSVMYIFFFIIFRHFIYWIINLSINELTD